MELSTLKSYRTFLNHLNIYNSQLKFNQISSSVIVGFRDYLVIEKQIKKSAARKYIECFSSVCKSAIRKGYLHKALNPFDNIENLGLQREKPKRVYLEVTEIQKIMDLKIPSNYTSLEQYRNDFLFLVHTGLYYNDFKALRKIDIIQTNEGVFIVSDRKKTDTTFYSPLYKFPYALNYLNESLKRHSELIFPERPVEQKMNKALKTIAKLAGIDKVLTVRSARHTFAQLCIRLGIERQFLSKFMGHLKESSTQVYYDVSPSDLAERVKDFNFGKLGLEKAI